MQMHDMPCGGSGVVVVVVVVVPHTNLQVSS
jgi:hypothetical protein